MEKYIKPSDMDAILAGGIIPDGFKIVKDFCTQNAEIFRTIKKYHEIFKNSQSLPNKEDLIKLAKLSFKRCQYSCYDSESDSEITRLMVDESSINDAINYYFDHIDDNLMSIMLNMAKILKPKTPLESGIFSRINNSFNKLSKQISGLVAAFIILTNIFSYNGEKISKPNVELHWNEWEATITCKYTIWF